MKMATGIPGYFRRAIHTLAGLSLVFGMLAVAPPAARAADPEPDYTATFEACFGEAIEYPGFADVPASHPNSEDISCIAYYTITRGTGNNTYSPDSPVTREQMALFLVRMAGVVGIDLPTPGSTPFTDIWNLSKESRDAISRIYELEITRGTGPNTYTPGGNVTRWQMALFLARLMDQMDTATDGLELYGYVPDDVDDNDDDHDIESPYQDLGRVTHEVHDAVTHLYELGVASGLNGTADYGPDHLMTRAAMAEFMAAILDHSNLRPREITVQMSSVPVGDKYKVTTMISIRDNRFRPVADDRVDWFYTDDPAGGLLADGACDKTKVLRGDCVWDQKDPSTDREGNIFPPKFDVARGKAITFYAWVGRRDGEAFAEASAHHDSATIRPTEARDGAGFLVKHDIPVHAAVMGQNALTVDRRSQVNFTIALLDSRGEPAAEEGTEITVRVESQDISVDADAVSGGRPRPDYTPLGGKSTVMRTLATDKAGEADYVLDGPSRDERLDTVTFSTAHGDDQIFRIAWSDSDPVLTSAEPSFDLYQYRSTNDKEVEFEIEYLLYDQYGELVDRRTDRYKQLDTDPSILLYEGKKGGTVFRFGPKAGGGKLDESVSLWRVRSTVELTGLDPDEEYFILLRPEIFTGTGNNRITYADPVIVWIVENARSEKDLAPYEDTEWGSIVPSLPSGVAFDEVGLYPGDGTQGKFRTFFTIWSYNSDGRLEVDDEQVGVRQFEEAWQQQVDDVDDIAIPIYGPFDYIKIE